MKNNRNYKQLLQDDSLYINGLKEVLQVYSLNEDEVVTGKLFKNPNDMNENSYKIIRSRKSFFEEFKKVKSESELIFVEDNSIEIFENEAMNENLSKITSGHKLKIHRRSKMFAEIRNESISKNTIIISSLCQFLADCITCTENLLVNSDELDKEFRDVEENDLIFYESINAFGTTWVISKKSAIEFSKSHIIND